MLDMQERLQEGTASSASFRFLVMRYVGFSACGWQSSAKAAACPLLADASSCPSSGSRHRLAAPPAAVGLNRFVAINPPLSKLPGKLTTHLCRRCQGKTPYQRRSTLP